MPIYDYECLECSEVIEYICTRASQKPSTLRCKKCRADAVPIITASGQYLGNQDADWLKTVTDVMDKDSTSPHVQTFLKNPTRENYFGWMKSEGRRPLEPGEPIRKGIPVDEAKVRQEVWERHLDRKRIVVGR